MKLYLAVLLILIGSFCSVNAQQNEKTLKLKKYLNTLSMFSCRDTLNKIASMEDKAFKKLVKNIYEGIEISPDELGPIFKDDLNKKVQLRKDHPDLDIISLGGIESLILDHIKKRCSNYMYILTRVPIFVKATVVSIREITVPGDYEVRGKKRSYHVHYLKLRTESILKGRADFLNNTEYEVWYMNWTSVPQEKDFKVGKTYLIPVWYRSDDLFPGDYSVATWVDEHGSRFLVENDIMDDEFEAFGMGTRVRWIDFVNKFNDNIYRIKNNMEF